MTTAQTAATSFGLADIMKPAPVVRDHQTCREAIRIMFEHPSSKCLVLCNNQEQPVGLLMSEPFFLKAAGQPGATAFYRQPALLLAQPHPLTADINDDPKAILTLAQLRHPSQSGDCIIVTQEGRLAGAVHVSDLKARLTLPRV